MISGACAGGCGGSCDRQASRTGESAPVATIGDSTITVKELRARLNEQAPYLRARYASLDRKKEFLDGLIRLELLTQEARRRGLERDPEIQAMLQKIMVQKLLRDVSGGDATNKPPEPELHAYYEKNVSEFVKPERIRLSHVFLASPGKDPQRGRVKSEAVKLLAEIKGKEPTAAGAAFEELARKRSEDSGTKASGGDLGFHTSEELSQAWGAELATAAAGLKTAGEIGPVVETERGLHLIRLTGRQAAMNQSFDMVRSRIETRLSAEHRTQSVDALIADLRKKANVQVHDDVLQTVTFGAEASPAVSPQPQDAQPHQ